MHFGCTQVLHSGVFAFGRMLAIVAVPKYNSLGPVARHGISICLWEFICGVLLLIVIHLYMVSAA